MMRLRSKGFEHFEFGETMPETKKRSGEESLIDALRVDTLTWQDNANCRGYDQDLFFLRKGGSARKAKAICVACEVQLTCSEYAIDNGELGVWGGYSERERRRIRVMRALEARKKVLV